MELEFGFCSHYFRRNLQQLLEEKPRFVINKEFVERYEDFFSADFIETVMKGDVEDFDVSPPVMSDVFSEDTFEKNLSYAATGPIRYDGSINLLSLRDTFGMTDEEISKYATTYLMKLSKFKGRYRERKNIVDEEMKPFMDKLRKRYEKDKIVEWWIIDDPSSQFTGSLKPKISTEKKW